MADDAAECGLEPRAETLDEDQALVSAARQDTEAAGRLYDKYYREILGYIYHCTLDRTVTEDLTSNVFLAAFRHLGRYRWRQIPFRAWVYRIATNEVRMHYRRHKRTRSVSLGPEHESDRHHQQLHRQVLTGLERRYVMSVNPRTWKIAAAIAALVCTAAAATAVVGVKIRQYYFEGQGKDGEYFFRSESETVYEKTYVDANGVVQGVRTAGRSLSSFDADDANGMTVEQMQSELEETELLRQQDIRELVAVTDMDVNGNAWRVCTFKYVFANGRTRIVNEGDPDRKKPASPEQIEKDFEEVARLRAQGVRDVVGVMDTEVEGQTHRTIECRYVLSDGREFEMGEADPALTPPTNTLSGEQIDEIWRLKLLGQAETLETIEQPMYGKTFVFERHLCTLADGTVATLAVGKVKGAKTDMTDADREELRGLVEANAGEFLGAYEQQIRGKVFAFERKRYTLSDGTQVIQAKGKPKDGQ